jgi:hypothetical protein
MAKSARPVAPSRLIESFLAFIKAIVGGYLP